MGFGAAVRDGLSNYVVVSGRAARSEFWWFYLFLWLVYLAATAVDLALGGPRVLSFLGALFVLIGSFTASIRRLHDTDRSGWWWLVGFIPFLGMIWLVVLLTIKGTPGVNRFGPKPSSPSSKYSSSGA